jgi:hypothetical protein
MKATFLLILTAIFITASFATDVSGNQSGLWTLANSPYNIIGDVTIPAGSSLSIEPGVTVNAMGNYRLTAAGFLYALATEVDSIRFRNGLTDPNAQWKGIRLESTTQGSHFGFCYVENAEYGINSINSPALIHHCHFYKNQKGMQLYGIGAADPAQVIVSNNIVEQSIENGILVAQNSNALIQNNEIRYNGTGAQYRGAIQLSNQSGGGSCSPLIQNNHIHHNFKQGITAWDIVSANAIQPEILNNVIEYNLTGIYLLNASGYVADNIIRYNFIPGDANSGAGVMVAGATSQPYFERNDVYGNFTGFYLGNNAQPCLGNLSIYHAWAQGENNIHDNIDESNTLHSVYCYSYTSSAIIVMAENNYWGANTAAEIGIGINDHLDDPALPTVDFDPWLEPVMPTSITGTVEYYGSHTVSNPRLQIVSYSTGAILNETPVQLGVEFSLSLPLTEQFHVVALADAAGQDLPLFGSPGGLLEPGVYSPGDLVPVNVGLFEIEDNTPPQVETVGAPYDDNGLIIHPVYHHFFVYAWDRINWFYDSGDWRYIKRHTRRVNGEEVEFELTYGTVWNKLANQNPGDTWTRTEVIDDAGTLRVSNIAYTVINDNWLTDRFPCELYIQSSPGDGIIKQRLNDTPEDLLYFYDGTCAVGVFSVEQSPGFELMLEGAVCDYLPLPLNEAPAYLGFDEQGLGLNPRQATLFWQAPATDGLHTWNAYRIYRDDEVLFATVPFTQTYCFLDNLLISETYFFSVRATDGTDESEPTNTVCIGSVAADDPAAAPPVLTAAPNPASLSAQGGILLTLKSGSEISGGLKIYNLRGQLVRAIPIPKGREFSVRWNLRDDRDRPCGSGIYFLKADLDNAGPLNRRLVLVR